jgi:hypothetical protein
MPVVSVLLILCVWCFIALHAIQSILRMTFAVAKQDVAAYVDWRWTLDSLDSLLTFLRSASCTWDIRRVAHVCLTIINRDFGVEQSERTRSLVPFDMLL